MKRIKDMPLSRNTHEHAIMMANQVEETQVRDINAAVYFSLTLDESTDVSHVSQFSVIARCVASDTLHFLKWYGSHGNPFLKYGHLWLCPP